MEATGAHHGTYNPPTGSLRAPPREQERFPNPRAKNFARPKAAAGGRGWWRRRIRRSGTSRAAEVGSDIPAASWQRRSCAHAKPTTVGLRCEITLLPKPRTTPCTMSKIKDSCVFTGCCCRPREYAFFFGNLAVCANTRKHPTGTGTTRFVWSSQKGKFGPLFIPAGCVRFRSPISRRAFLLRPNPKSKIRIQFGVGFIFRFLLNSPDDSENQWRWTYLKNPHGEHNSFKLFQNSACL